MNDTTAVERVRRVIVAVVGAHRIAGAEADEHLLRSGRVSSLEVVEIAVALEEEFGRAIPDERIAGDSFTLRGLARAATGGAQSPDTERGEDARTRWIAARVRRPLTSLFVAAITLMALDVALGVLMRTTLAPHYTRFLEDGARLYPYTGELAHDDFEFAVRHHEIQRGSEGRSVVLLGDSGTIGSFVGADETIAAAMEDRLSSELGPCEVWNLSFYARLLAKDVMLLEATWEHRPDLVVISLGRHMFDRRFVASAIEDFRHCRVNHDLFESFIERVPVDERGPFEDQLHEIEVADRADLGFLTRLAFRTTAIAHYRPFVHDATGRLLVPRQFMTPTRYDRSHARHERVLVTETETLQTGVPHEHLDPRQAQMLTGVVRVLQARGVRCLLYVTPELPLDWDREWTSEGTSVQALCREVSAATGVAVVDTTGLVPTEDYVDSPNHYTARGNSIIGRAIAEAVLREGLLE